MGRARGNVDPPVYCAKTGYSPLSSVTHRPHPHGVFYLPGTRTPRLRVPDRALALCRPARSGVSSLSSSTAIYCASSEVRTGPEDSTLSVSGGHPKSGTGRGVHRGPTTSSRRPRATFTPGGAGRTDHVVESQGLRAVSLTGVS